MVQTLKRVMPQFIKTNSLTKYVKEAYIELRKVSWPNQETVRKHTILVIGLSIFLAVYFVVVDYLLNLGLETII